MLVRSIPIIKTVGSSRRHLYPLSFSHNPLSLSCSPFVGGLQKAPCTIEEVSAYRAGNPRRINESIWKFTGVRDTSLEVTDRSKLE